MRSAILQTFLALATLCALVLVARSAFLAGGTRSWWYYNGNDACQGFSAQSASMRLGAPIQTVAWPGATLPTAYLYYNSLFGSAVAVPLSAEATEQLLDETVHFHWMQAGVFGFALLAIVYMLAARWTTTSVVGLAVAGTLSWNDSFLFALFHVRAEVPSLVFVLLACLWAESAWTLTRPVLRPLIFGALVSLAVISKLQVLPALPLVLFLYIRRNLQDGSWNSKPIPRFAAVVFACVAAAGALGLLRTSFIDASTYGLHKLPSTFAHSAMATSLVLTGLLLVVALGKFNTVSRWSAAVLAVSAGAVLAIGFVLLPVLWFGGVQAIIASANKLVYGTVSFARYGLQLEADGGWGRTGSFVGRARSFIEFQASSGTGGWNLSVWIGLMLVGCAILSTIVALITRRGADGDFESVARVRKSFLLGLLLYATALLCDLATTHRTVSVTSYSFYHIYSLPFYFLAGGVALGACWTGLPHYVRTSLSARYLGLAMTVVVGIWSLQLLLQAGRLKQWEAPTKAPEHYFGEGSATNNIGGVAPEFWKLSGQRYETVRDFVIARDKAERDAKAAPKSP